MAENVDGEVLSEVDENTLRNDLELNEETLAVIRDWFEEK